MAEGDDKRRNNKKSIWLNGFTRIVRYEGGGRCESGRQREGDDKISLMQGSRSTISFVKSSIQQRNKSVDSGG